MSMDHLDYRDAEGFYEPIPPRAREHFKTYHRRRFTLGYIERELRAAGCSSGELPKVVALVRDLVEASQMYCIEVMGAEVVALKKRLDAMEKKEKP